MFNRLCCMEYSIAYVLTLLHLMKSATYSQFQALDNYYNINYMILILKLQLILHENIR